MTGLIAVGYFLVSLIFNLILFALWARIALRYFRISSLNSFSKLIYSITDTVFKPLCSLLRYQYLTQQKYDWPALLLIILIEIIKVSLLSLILYHAMLPFFWLIIYVLADFIVQPINFLFYAILARVIMSYANPHWHHPIADVLIVITQPLLIVGRKIIPDISGFDFSPFIMMILFKVFTLFIHATLPVQLL